MRYAPLLGLAFGVCCLRLRALWFICCGIAFATVLVSLISASRLHVWRVFEVSGWDCGLC